MILIYADDIKLFLRVDTFYNQILLQKDLETIAEWSAHNRLVLNCEKCKVLSFGRSEKNKLTYKYTLDGIELESVERMKDLGVIFDRKFTFDEHISKVTNKALSTLGFIKRSTKEFTDTQSVISLYKSLVLPILLHGSVIWSPHYDVHMKKLESFQHRLLKYLAFKSGTPMSFIDHDYSRLASEFNLPSILSLHAKNDHLFLKKINLNLINSADVKNLFEVRNINYWLRYPRELAEQSSPRNYVFHSSVNRLTRNWNKLPLNVRTAGNLAYYKRVLYPVIFSYL